MLTKLTKNEYEHLIAHARVLKMRGGKPYIFLTQNNLIIKHIYLRNFFSSSFFFPYSKRFVNNAKRLKTLGFISPDILNTYYYKEANCDIVVYPYLAGETMQALLKANAPYPMHKIIEFIAELHAQGIYFRDLHLNNLIQHQDNIALIDVTSIKFYSKPLTLTQRARNLAHLFNKEGDKEIYLKYGAPKIVAEYLALTHSENDSALFIKTMLKTCKRQYIIAHFNDC